MAPNNRPGGNSRRNRRQSPSTTRGPGHDRESRREYRRERRRNASNLAQQSTPTDHAGPDRSMYATSTNTNSFSPAPWWEDRTREPAPSPPSRRASPSPTPRRTTTGRPAHNLLRRVYTEYEFPREPGRDTVNVIQTLHSPRADPHRQYEQAIAYQRQVRTQDRRRELFSRRALASASARTPSRIDRNVTRDGTFYYSPSFNRSFDIRRARQDTWHADDSDASFSVEREHWGPG